MPWHCGNFCKLTFSLYFTLRFDDASTENAGFLARRKKYEKVFQELYGNVHLNINLTLGHTSLFASTSCSLKNVKTDICSMCVREGGVIYDVITLYVDFYYC